MVKLKNQLIIENQIDVSHFANRRYSVQIADKSSYSMDKVYQGH